MPQKKVKLWLTLFIQVYSVCIVRAGNLALHQPTKASSQHGMFLAEEAVDGSSKTTMISNPIYCMHSEVEANPWWTVDLGKSYIVDQIEVLGRSDCCLDKLSGAMIRVGDSLVKNGTNNTICAKIEMVTAPLRKVFNCSNGTRGRYVTIHLIGEGKVLQLCEVIVNRNPTSENSRRENSKTVVIIKETKEATERDFDIRGNMALNKITAQSSTIPNIINPISSKAVDGNSDGIFEEGSCTHTAEDKTNPWWRVDFGESKDVSEVFIVNRLGHFHRLSNFEIRVGDSITNEGNDNPRCGETLYTMATLLKASFFCKPRKRGRYLNIRKISQNEVLALCEVEVYSESKAFLKNKPQNPTTVQVLGLRSALSLTCPEPFGYPVPHVAWAREGKVFQNSTTSSIFSGSALKERDAVWECIASNVHGSDYHQFIIQGSYRMCAKYKDVLVAKRSIHRLIKSLSEATNDNAMDKSVWFRLRDAKTMTSMQIPNTCVSPWRCSTQATGWMPDAHPQLENGVVQRTVCFSWNGNCCLYNTTVLVRKCHGFYVYKLQGSLTPDVNAGLCAETSKVVDPNVMFKSDKPNYALQDHVIYTEKDLVIQECIAVCLSDFLCQSVNYHKDTKACEMNNATQVSSPLQMKKSPGSQYYEKVGLSSYAYDPKMFV